MTEGCVAVMAQKATHLSGAVIMIDMPVVFRAGGVATADCATVTLSFEHRLVLLESDTPSLQPRLERSATPYFAKSHGILASPLLIRPLHALLVLGPPFAKCLSFPISVLFAPLFGTLKLALAIGSVVTLVGLPPRRVGTDLMLHAVLKSGQR
jgi:hypothetical protein